MHIKQILPVIKPYLISKKVKFNIYFLLNSVLFLIILILNSLKLTSQKPLPIRCFDSLEYLSHLDTLEKQFGKNKIIPDNMKLEVLLTLAYFPELKNSKIKFKKSLIFTTLNARPTVWSVLFKKKEKRNYIVRINKTTRDSMVTYNEVPFNAKIGLLSHEFTHFVDYLDKNIGGVAKRLKMYMRKDTKREYEHEIDSLTVSRKLGWQLYDFSYFVLNTSDASAKYKIFKKYTYMLPEEILNIMYSPGDQEMLANSHIFSSKNANSINSRSFDDYLNWKYEYINSINNNALEESW